MALYDNLFEPIQVGPVTIPNRIVRSAHATRTTGSALIAYHEERARGGVGMSILEASSVHPNAPTVLPVFSDDVLPFFREISARMHMHGMKLMAQLYHPGASTRLPSILTSAVSVSEYPNPLYNVTPVPMTKSMIDEMIERFAKSARRIRDGGLDGVEIHASSGYLIHEFLSPALNKRSDEYGGSTENRTRFLKEIIAAIRAEIGSDIAVGVRLPNEDYVVGGLDPEENARVAVAVEADVDYVALHMGSYWRFHKLFAPSDDPLGAEMPFNNRITPSLSKPTMVVGRIMTLDHASAIVRAGEGDMVSMVRALIADPELPNKARRLEEHRIRPCISTNMGCIGQVLTKGVLSCVVNRSAAKEETLPTDAVTKALRIKKILVVGGGPAGLEAARTAAMRGHKVELHEATGRLGGQVALARMAPHRADVGMIVDWLASELEILGVDVHLNSMIDIEMIEQVAPDEVIVATGSMPRADGFQITTPASPIPGYEQPHVHNSWEIFGVGSRVAVGKTAVVFDDTGTFEAISVTEMLLKAGAKVTLVSRFEKIGEALPFPPATVGPARERLMAADIDFFGGHYLRGIGRDTVDVGVLWTDRSRTIAADTVVLVGFNQLNRDLLQALEGGSIPAHPVGDLLGRGDLMTALHSGAELAHQL